MYVGRIVEIAGTQSLYEAPKHPYTEALLSAVPKPDPRIRADRVILEREVADPANPPPGCHFHPRCRYAQERCRVEAPPLQRDRTEPLGLVPSRPRAVVARRTISYGLGPLSAALTQLIARPAARTLVTRDCASPFGPAIAIREPRSKQM